MIFCPTHDTASAVCGSPVGPENMVQTIRDILEMPDLPIGDVINCV